MNKDIEILNGKILLRGIIENYEAEKLVVLVHGFTGNLDGPDDIFKKLSAELQGVGFAVLRFSFWGTEPSEGGFEDMTIASEVSDMNKVLEYTESLGYREIGLLGESMWGTIIAEAYRKSLKFMIFWYSAFNLLDTDFKDIFFTEDAQKEVLDNWYMLFEEYKIWGEFISKVSEIDVFDNLERITCPTLLLHGDKDDDVPFQQSEKAFKSLKCLKEIEIIKWAGHCFRNEQDEAVGITVKFLEERYNNKK